MASTSAAASSILCRTTQHRLTPPKARPAQPLSRQIPVHSRDLRVHARGRNAGRELTTFVGVAPAPPEPSASEAPGSSSWGIINVLLLIPAALLGYKILKVIKRATQGSLARIEDRGHLERERDANGTIPWDADSVAKSMQRVRYTDYDHLSEDQIAKARKRRERERDDSDISLQDVHLPENHPWATDDANDDLTEDLIKERLSVRRGIPRQSHDPQQQL